VTLRAGLERYPHQIEIGAINTSGSMPVEGWLNLFKYDSVYGKLSQEVQLEQSAKNKEHRDEIGAFLIKDKRYPILAQRNPAKIPWKRYEVDLVLECTGVFRTAKEAKKHHQGGAKKVIISAPARDPKTPTFIVGVNADKYRGEVISNASCTTNCIAPIAKVMMRNFKVVKASMTTIHAYTADQQLVDGSHRDLRRARAAGMNTIPTTTGAARALAKVLPFYKGKFEGMAIRVPVSCGSLVDFTFLLDQTVRKEKINRVFEQASGESEYQGIIEVTNDPIVSSDIIGNSASAVVDLSLTKVSGGSLVKLLAWYDNEWAYSCRLLELAILVGGYK
jgi:glyceraldehyde 3-phosphate dehydrogenase